MNHHEIESRDEVIHRRIRDALASMHPQMVTARHRRLDPDELATMRNTCERLAADVTLLLHATRRKAV
jgi:hypothetical protein